MIAKKQNGRQIISIARKSECADGSEQARAEKAPAEIFESERFGNARKSKRITYKERQIEDDCCQDERDCASKIKRSCEAGNEAARREKASGI